MLDGTANGTPPTRKVHHVFFALDEQNILILINWSNVDDRGEEITCLMMNTNFMTFYIPNEPIMGFMKYGDNGLCLYVKNLYEG